RVEPVAGGGGSTPGGGAGGVLPGQPQPGQFGSVAPQNQQPPATYGTPGDLSTRLTENEHIMPHAQLRDMTTNPRTGVADYTDNSYANDATLRVERGMALNKTYANRGGPTADNPRTTAIQANLNAGRGVNYRENIFEPSRQNAIRAAQATGSAVTEEQINTSILSQEGNLFNTFRGGAVLEALPPQTTGQRISESVRNFGRSIVYTTGGQNRFSGMGGALARGLIPGFVEAEIGAMAAPYIVASAGITNATIVSTAAAAAAAPTAAATVVVGSAVGGFLVGSAVGHAVTEATGSQALGAGAGTLAGAATGALIGAAVGSVVPVLGTAAGAIIGGAVGAIAGFIGSIW
ncbi:MAG: repeat protein, partial [Verrucomicrobia bacterium]|nr:repeat protein [Verrucomicrobiota bacterium]